MLRARYGGWGDAVIPVRDSPAYLSAYLAVLQSPRAVSPSRLPSVRLSSPYVPCITAMERARDWG